MPPKHESKRIWMVEFINIL